MILTETSQLPSIPRRIISLVPSQTALLHTLGLEEETIGITRFCIHPAAWFSGKTRIGGTKALDIETITGLAPDLIIANKEENIKEQVEALAAHFPVWVTDVNNYNDALQMIGDIGALTGKTAEANALVCSIDAAFKQWQPVDPPIPTAYLIWKNPYMTIGGDTFISDMLLKSGFQNVFAHLKRYPEITVEQLRQSQCTLVLLSSEPYPFAKKHIQELQLALPGVKIKLANGEMFSWYGSHLLKSPEYFKNLYIECQ